MRVRTLLLAFTIALLASAAKGQGSPPVADRATRSGRTIILHPSEATFDVPAAWITWYNKFHNNLHLSSKEIDSVRVGQGEWDSEYAEVVNSVLPFQDCVAHVGGEGWGKGGVSFGDVQLRAYLTSLNEEHVKQSVSAQGLSTAQKIDSGASLLRTVTEGPWRRTTIKYSLFYGDYGGIARIDFYTRSDQGQTFVLVLMYCDSNRFGAIEEAASILHSFRVPSHQVQF